MASFCSEADWYFSVLDRPYFQAQLQDWLRQVGRTELPSTSSDQIINDNDDFNTQGMLLDTLYFPAALFQVLAISLQFLPMTSPVRQSLNLPSPSASDKLSRLYSDFGVELVSLLGRHNSTSTAVLADLLRCSWLKNTGRGNEAWFSLGDAVR